MKSVVLVWEAKSLIGLEVSEGRPEVLFSFPLDAAVKAEALAALLRKARADGKIPSSGVGVVVMRNQVLLKKFPCPRQEAGHPEAFLKEKWDEEIPFSQDEALWDWESQSAQGGSSVLWLLASRRDLIAKLLRACNLAGLRCGTLMLSTVELVRMVSALDEGYRRGTVGVVHAGPSTFECLALKEGRLMFSRGTHALATREGTVEEVVRSVKAFQQECPQESWRTIVVCGEEAVGLTEAVEQATRIPSVVGFRHPYPPFSLSKSSKPGKGEKGFRLLEAFNRTKRGETTLGDVIVKKWKTIALGVAVVGTLLFLAAARRVVRHAEELDREYRDLSAKIAKEPERPWLSVLRTIQLAIPRDVVVNALKVTDKDEVTIEFTAESFEGLESFNNALVHSPLFSRPQPGPIRKIIEKNRELYRFQLKARFIGTDVRRDS